MKKYILPSIKMTIVFIVICSVIYPLLIAATAKLGPGGGRGETLSVNGKVVGYKNIGQKFTNDQYFQGRPSAVDYNAAGSAGSNKGPSNPDYLKQVEERIDTFLAHNPTIKRNEIPADLVTASGSGLDPDISPEAAYVQVARIAAARKLSVDEIRSLVKKSVKHPVLGIDRLNVLEINIALDKL